MTRKKKTPVENLLRGWNKIRHIMDNQSNIMNRTEKYILSTFKKEDDIVKRFLELRNDFYSVDFHPLETGANDEHDKWEVFMKNMKDFLEELI